MSPAPVSRDLSLDVLRGGAILYIVGYYHIDKVWMVTLPDSLGRWLARVALALLCFLSGYLLSRSATVGNWGDVWVFYRRRLLRIYPLYFLALVLFIWSGIIKENRFWPGVLLYNTLIDLEVRTLWFISMIFVFYLLTPLFLWRKSEQRTLWLALGITGALSLAWFGFAQVDARLIPNFVAFAFGIWLSTKKTLTPMLLAPGWKSLLASLIGTALLAIFTLEDSPDDEEWLAMVGIVAWLLLSLPMLNGVGQWLAKHLPLRIIAFFSTSSFVLYLIHRIIYLWGEKIWSPTGWLLNLYYVLILLPLAAGLSYGIQVLYHRVVK